MILALLIASALFTAVASVDPNAWLTHFVFVAYSLCMCIAHCTSMRVVEGYSHTKQIFDTFALAQRLCYTSGCLIGGFAGPTLYFEESHRRQSASVVFMLLSFALTFLGATAGYFFFSNVVHISTYQLLRLVDLEAAYERRHRSSAQDDPLASIFDNTSPRRRFLHSRDGRKSLMDLVRDLKGRSNVPPA